MTNSLSSVSRRTTLKWVMSSVIASGTAACGQKNATKTASRAEAPGLGEAAPVSGATYGYDPDLINPVLTWDKTMTSEQLRAAASLSDMILPADERSPAASTLGVQDFVDEWISAPYEDQQRDRDIILDGLSWLHQKSVSEHEMAFWDLTDAQRAGLLDQFVDVQSDDEELQRASAFFSKFRYLAVSAFYSTPEGMEDIGYMGNSPMVGEYPGPTQEALAHLDAALEKLGLERTP